MESFSTREGKFRLKERDQERAKMNTEVEPLGRETSLVLWKKRPLKMFFSLFSCLFASVNSEIVFCKEAISKS